MRLQSTTHHRSRRCHLRGPRRHCRVPHRRLVMVGLQDPGGVPACRRRQARPPIRARSPCWPHLPRRPRRRQREPKGRALGGVPPTSVRPRPGSSTPPWGPGHRLGTFCSTPGSAATSTWCCCPATGFETGTMSRQSCGRRSAASSSGRIGRRRSLSLSMHLLSQAQSSGTPSSSQCHRRCRREGTILVIWGFFWVLVHYPVVQ